MKASVCCLVALMGMAGEITAAENNSSLAPLTTQASEVGTTRVLGVCHPAPNGDYSVHNLISPIGEAGFYLRKFEHQQVKNIGTVTVLEPPAHGSLRLISEADRGVLFDSSAGPVKPEAGLYAYLPEAGYLGKDSATLLVEIGGIQVKVRYFFQALGPAARLGNYGLDELCGETGYHWKISSTLDANAS